MAGNKIKFMNFFGNNDYESLIIDINTLNH